jgi:hypothetical protein
MNPYYFIFIISAFAAIFIQAKSRSYQDLIPSLSENTGREKDELKQLLLIRRFMSPFIAGLTAFLIFLAALEGGHLAELIPRIFIPVWLLASVGDIYIEGAYSIEDKKRQEGFYLIGMVLFMGMTVLLGLGLIVNARQTSLSPLAHLVSISIPIVLGLGAFFTLKLNKETLAAMIVYDLAVSILLCGGLYSAFAGQGQLAYIGIGYFISDWLVGQRDFGKKKFPFLDRWILLLILLLYYSIMLVSLDVVLRLS